MKSSFNLSGVKPGADADFARRLVDYLFDFTGPKYLFDDLYHFSVRHYKRHQNNRNMLPVVKLMLTARPRSRAVSTWRKTSAFTRACV